MIPKGWKVFASFRAVHLDPDNFEDARTFDPWRWQVCRWFLDRSELSAQEDLVSAGVLINVMNERTEKLGANELGECIHPVRRWPEAVPGIRAGPGDSIGLPSPTGHSIQVKPSRQLS